MSVSTDKTGNVPHVEKKGAELLVSCVVAVGVTMLLLFPSLTMAVVKPRLYDGTINVLGRYSMNFDAYEHISRTSDSPVIAIGSSKMREAFDGQLLSEIDDHDHDFYNLALAGDLPYVRMLETSAIIDLNPTFVVIEIGPNTFSSLATPVPESVQSRMAHIASLGAVDLESIPMDVLNQSDMEMLPISRKDQLEHLSSYVPKAIDGTLKIELMTTFSLPHPCLESPEDIHASSAAVVCVPLPDDPAYDEYLRYPTQFPNTLKSIKAGNSSLGTIEEFYGPALDSYLNRSNHNPEGIVNKNQISFEYMIEQFTSAGIEVILVGLPYNPVLLERLDPGQWDYYNQTIESYNQLDLVTVCDMMWDLDWKEEHFNDYVHMSREGELLFTDKLMQHIAPLLEG